MKPEIALAIATVNTVESYQAKTGISTLKLANAIGIRTKQVFLNKLCITNTDNHFLPKHLFALQKLSGDKSIGDVFAWVSAQSVAGNEPSEEDVADLLLTLSVNSGEVIKVVRDAIADGEVTQVEYKESLKAISREMQGLQKLEALLVNAVGAGARRAA